MSPGLVGGLIKEFTFLTGKCTGDLNETMNVGFIAVATGDVSVFGHAVAVENSSNGCWLLAASLLPRPSFSCSSKRNQIGAFAVVTVDKSLLGWSCLV